MVDTNLETPILTRAEKEQRRKEREAEIRLKNNRLGLTIFQISWIMVFMSLIVVHYWVRFSVPEWPPAGVSSPDLLLPTLSTIGVIISMVLAHQATKAVKADNLSRFNALWLGTMGLMVAFFLVMIYQFSVIDLTDGQYAFVFRLMIGYHGVHAIVVGIFMVQVYRYALAGRYHSKNFWAVEGTERLWHFVAIAWILFYVVLYLI